MIALALAAILAAAAAAPVHGQTVPRVGSSFAEVGSQGGSIRGSGATVVVPPGLASAGGALSVTIVPQSANGLPPAPAGTILSGTPFSLLVVSAAGQPVTLDAPIDVRATLTSTQPALPQFYTLVSGQWIAIPSEVDGREVVGSWMSGTVIALFVRPVPGELPRTGATPSVLISLFSRQPSSWVVVAMASIVVGIWGAATYRQRGVRLAAGGRSRA